MNILFIDTETTGKYDFKLPPDHPTQPYLVQLACILAEDDGQVLTERSRLSVIVKPEGWNIPQEVAAIHGIDDEIAGRCGINIKSVAFLFNQLCLRTDLLVAHNLDFDRGIMASVMARLQLGHRLNKLNRYCTMRSATPITKILRNPTGTNTHNFKWPSLTECMKFFFNEDFSGQAHDAMNDVTACARVYWELKIRGA